MNMKVYYGALALLLGLSGITAGCSSQNKDQATQSTVHLRGQIIDLGVDQVELRYNGATSQIGTSRDVTLHLDAQGYVDTVLTIDAPSYYSIGRNILYLTPGDDLEVNISAKADEATFTGRGAEANNYLKGRVLPKRGSFLDGGRNIVDSFEKTKAVVDSLARVRMSVLDTLSGVSDEFKELESARIKADVINSYIYYPMYANTYTGPDAQKLFAEVWQKHSESLAEEMRERFGEITNAKYLDVATVRDVLKHHQDTVLHSLWFEGVQIPEQISDFYEVVAYSSRLKGHISEELARDAMTFVSTVKHEPFASELKYSIKKATKLFAGEPAIDIEMTDIEGNPRKLSDFKGRLIYVDLWATWCGPCLKEAPLFEALAKRYEGKDIVFVPIGTDTKAQVWREFLAEHKKELPQYHTTDAVLHTDWAVDFIPRFILIDKDFRIIDAHAPRPSEEAIVGLIDTWLAK